MRRFGGSIVLALGYKLFMAWLEWDASSAGHGDAPGDVEAENA